LTGRDLGRGKLTRKICRKQPAKVHNTLYVEDEDEPLGGRIVIDEALCNECGVCATVCCGSAIEMQDIDTVFV
jgi:Pyruvate/2-oxoacid:ferredoxin oxidoreductase delta subunit